MTISEVFPNPTVKQVIFQIRFPNLFFIERKIGDLQLKIMTEFPESAMLYRKQILFADVGPEAKEAEIRSELEKGESKKIWQFKSKKNVVLNVLSDSLDITSQYHKTYQLEGADKFRDIIQFVLEAFLSLVSIPTIVRIGLRYVDECPIPSKDDETFRTHYNTTFPLNRFSLTTASEMDFKTVVKKGDYYLRYIESLQKVAEAEDQYKLILDFDAYANNIDPANYLSITDQLHAIISDEFEETIKEPVYTYMRQREGV